MTFLENQTIEDCGKFEDQQPHVEEYSEVDNPFSSTANEDVEDHSQGHDDASIQNESEESHEDVKGQPLNEQASDLAPRGSAREHRPSRRYSQDEYIMLTGEGEPENYEEVKSSKESEQWLKAMKEEMKSLHDNHTYDLVKLPKGKKALKNKWVFRLKYDEKSLQPRYKARLVVKGFSQKQGIDFDEIFSPVVKMSSIRVALGLAAHMDLEIKQLDVKTAFLHGDLMEEIYME